MGGKTVYFGDVGQKSRDVISYFERNGAFKCSVDANPAEYILDVIGAGATASTDRDWHDVWMRSPEQESTVSEIQALKAESTPSAGTGSEVTSDGDFAATWFAQYRAVQARVFRHYWRSPRYIMSKVFLNTMAGLFLGFTFYREPNSVQGLQNKVSTMW
jgi:ATP-binding cassette subfamily G (WHITE) protein 2 (SNQ2)